MQTSIVKALVVPVLLAAGALALPGCYVRAAVVEPVAVDGYTPEYYEGYVVYYDDGGRPFYYVNGNVVWVPSHSPYYVRLTNHWRVNGSAYRRWHVNHGTRYRTYRRR
jgi:hypothetical protein